MKRKITAENGDVESTRPLKQSKGIQNAFGEGIFDKKTVKSYKTQYADSTPYRHAVVHNLISDSLLRSVRNEVLENIHFTPKETDIYKIHQSGDLANLSGLPASALSRLPSLLRLRDALYSTDFRDWISEVSGAGALSGRKTDMAVNVYATGCHLLCHDDVIGSRRVSYILYLTDPDRPWQASWGGALRLYPTVKRTSPDGGKEDMVPDHTWSKSVPPAWSQLSFFAVQPGQSFHDVEEVYKRGSGGEDEVQDEDDGGRIRMAISGWYHIPQEGEDGYEEGLEEKLAEQSSLQQLQGKDDSLDLPQRAWIEHGNQTGVETEENDEEDVDLSEKDLDFLLKFMTPHYLTPDTVEELSSLFAEESSLQLANLLSKKFSAALKDEISSADARGQDQEQWEVARPPYKQRYLFRQPKGSSARTSLGGSCLTAVINDLLSSLAFKKWLSLATGLSLGKTDVLARRFRRGLDYTLATAHEEDDAQLEYCLNLTPSKGWGADEPEEGDDAPAENGHEKPNGYGQPKTYEAEGEDTVGGYELYMAGEDDEEDDEDDGSDHGVEIPSGVAQASATGGGNRRIVKQKKKADPAVYQASAAEDEDDGILFTNPAAWNVMSIVLRDKGTLKFVKYVSKAAHGDRWDVSGTVEVLDDGSDDDDDDSPDKVPANGEIEEDEEEWNGIED